MATVLMKKGNGMKSKPFGVLVKFVIEKESETYDNSTHPLRYTVRYENLNEQGKTLSETSIVYRAEIDTTLAQAESRWFFDFSFSNLKLLSITREQV